MKNDAEYLLCILYKEYTERRNEGKSKRESSHFGSSKNVYETFFGEWGLEDLDDTLRELHRLEYVSCFYASGTIYEFSLTSAGIEYMEKRFKNKFDYLIDTISKLKSIIF